MPRKKLRSRKIMRPVLLDQVKTLLLYGPHVNFRDIQGTGMIEAFRLTKDPTGPKTEAVWKEHKAEVLAAWKKTGNKGPCWAERKFSGDTA
ncbi:hypothetical protein ACFL4N_03935 [Thermodesulfobacteriota bacterium]